jgi:TolB-like protein/tetratricopeptide (TPR) repeat protein
MKYRLSDLTIDTGRQLVERAGQTIALPKLSYDLLLALMKAAPNVVSLDELMCQVWPNIVVSPETVSQRVKLLRDALGDDPREPRYIAGLRGRGYQVIANLEELQDTQRPASAPLPEAATAGPSFSPSPAMPPKVADRVAMCVLPFTNMSGDPQQDYFSDGITEDIITELSRWRILSVRSRSASFRYRGAAVDMEQVARELHVRFIVEGSVRRIGARIRISAQLIDMETGSHIWAEKFDRDAPELFAVQDQVVQTIVSTLVGRVQASDVARAGRKPSTSLAAYECVLKGNSLPWDNPAAAAEAKSLFEKAIAIDPTYGHAHSLLAALLWDKWQDDPGGSDAALLEGLTLAERAVELDKNECTCFALLGFGNLLHRSFDLAFQYSQRAVQMNPTNQWVAADMGSMLAFLGKPEESLSWFKRVLEIDPYFDEPWYWRSLGQTQMMLGNYQEALAAFHRVPVRTFRTSLQMAACHARIGDIQTAKAFVADSLVMKPGLTVARLMAKKPFKNAADAASFEESYRMAGLPD